MPNLISINITQTIGANIKNMSGELHRKRFLKAKYLLLMVYFNFSELSNSKYVIIIKFIKKNNLIMKKIISIIRVHWWRIPYAIRDLSITLMKK